MIGFNVAPDMRSMTAHVALGATLKPKPAGVASDARSAGGRSAIKEDNMAKRRGLNEPLPYTEDEQNAAANVAVNRFDWDGSVEAMALKIAFIAGSNTADASEDWKLVSAFEYGLEWRAEQDDKA